jgi:hypothetical protein
MRSVATIRTPVTEAPNAESEGASGSDTLLIMVVLLERPRGGECQPVGHALEQCSLRSAPQGDRLWREPAPARSSAGIPRFDYSHDVPIVAIHISLNEPMEAAGIEPASEVAP